MGLLDRVFRPSKHDAAIVEKAASDAANQVLATLMGSRRKPPARGVTELLGSYNTVPKLRRVVARIAHSVASVQWYAGYETAAKSRSAIYGNAQRAQSMEARHKAVTLAKEQGRFREVPEHPLMQLLMKPNTWMSGFDLTYLTTAYLDLVGEAFWLKDYQGAGKPTMLWPMPPTWIREIPTAGDPAFHMQIPGTSRISVDPGRVVWFRELDIEQPYGRGSGIGITLGDELDSDEYAAQLIKTVFYNDATPRGIVTLKGAKEDQAKDFKQKWEEAHRGHRRHGRTQFSGSEVSYHRIDQSFEELELLELRKAMAAEVRETYAVPPEILGVLENSNRSTINAAETFMAKFVVIPRLERYCRALDMQLVPEFDDRLVLYHDDPTPADVAAQREHVKAHPWIATLDEHRTKFGGMEPAQSNGNVRFGLINVVPQNAPGVAPPSDTPPADDGDGDDDGEVSGKPEGARLSLQARPSSTRTKDADTDMANQVVAALVPERLTMEMDPIWGTELEAVGNRTLQDIGVGMSMDMLNPFIAEHLDSLFYTRIPDLVDKTTEQALYNTIVEGVRGGEGMEKLSKRVFKVFAEGQLAVDTVRAERIARTEVMRSANFGIYHAHTVSGVIEKRMWITAFVNSRKEHENLHGQVVGITEPFLYGGMSAYYPGGWGVGYMDINCGCVTVPVIDSPGWLRSYKGAWSPDATEADLEQVWKTFLNEQEPWVQLARRAIARGLWAQHDDVQAALRKAALAAGI